MTKSAEDYFESGNFNFLTRRFEAAIADFDKSIELGPEQSKKYYNRGIAKRNLKQYKNAIADYDKAIELSPEHSSTYNNRGNAKSDLKQYEDAIADYDKAIELSPKDAAAYNNRGRAKSALKQHKDAIDDYDKAIELRPKNAAAYNNRGNAKSDLKQHKGSIADYDKAIELGSENGTAYYGRGNEYQRTGQTEKAKTDFIKLASLTRERPPKILYKYIPINPHQLLSLINEEIYFSLYSQLNDPLECFFLNEDAMMGECFQQSDIVPRICSMVKYIPNAESSEPTLMFAHYANEHKGICVGYEIDLEQLKENKSVAYGEVLYEQKNEAYNLKDLYMLKDPAWKYEKEFRFVRFDNNEFSAAKVKSVTFGLKCPIAHREIIRYLLPEDVTYDEMTHRNEGNQIIKQSVIWPDEKLSQENIFKLMLNENLTHLYFYHQQKDGATHP